MEILVLEFEAPWHKQPSFPISPTPLGKLFTVFSGVERNIPASANIMEPSTDSASHIIAKKPVTFDSFQPDSRLMYHDAQGDSE